MTGLDEEPLAGGLESGRVVRIGETVRRPPGPWTATIHALLTHLQGKRFPAPLPIGFDEVGRETLSFIDGRAGNWPWPPALLELRGVRQIAELLTDYHGAVADFTPPSPVVWRQGACDPAPGEIVLHGDFGPYNLIWRDEELVGVIDWDLAHPGRPIEDAAFAASQCVPLRENIAPLGFASPPDRRARLEAFAEAYGAFTAAELIAGLFEVSAANIGRMERLGAQEIEPWNGWVRRGLLSRTHDEMAWLRGWTATEGLLPEVQAAEM